MNPVAPPVAPVSRDLAPPAITFEDVRRTAGRLRDGQASQGSW